MILSFLPQVLLLFSQSISSLPSSYSVPTESILMVFSLYPPFFFLCYSSYCHQHPSSWIVVVVVESYPCHSFAFPFYSSVLLSPFRDDLLISFFTLGINWESRRKPPPITSTILIKLFFQLAAGSKNNIIHFVHSSGHLLMTPTTTSSLFFH